MSPRLQRILFYAGLFALWAWLAYMKFWPGQVLPSPFSVGNTLRRGFADHSFQIGIARSLGRIAIGYGLSASAGILLGLLTARIRWLGHTVGSLVVGLQSLPSICWVPAALLWFGPSEGAIFFVVIMGSMLAISVGTDDAVKNLPAIYVRAARTMGVGGLRLYREVIFPAALPGILSAMKQGWTFAWRSLMGAELLFATPGLGRLLQNGRVANDISQVAAVMVVIMALGWFVDRFVFSSLEERIRARRGMTA